VHALAQGVHALAQGVHAITHLPRCSVKRRKGVRADKSSTGGRGIKTRRISPSKRSDHCLDQRQRRHLARSAAMALHLSVVVAKNISLSPLSVATKILASRDRHTQTACPSDVDMDNGHAIENLRAQRFSKQWSNRPDLEKEREKASLLRHELWPKV
jgi:hypothetical protein